MPAATSGPRLTLVLLTLTAATGLIDGISYLGMGHVLVANMTGNVVFLGFALTGARGFTLAPFLVALGAFLVGAVLGGRIGTAFGARPRQWLVTASGTQTVLAAAAAVISAVATVGPTGTARFGVIAVLGVGSGLQNATIRRLAVPDLTTTVLTMTLTGLAADSALAGGAHPRRSLRVGSAATMLVGALVGGALVPHAGIPIALTVLTVVLAAVTGGFAFLAPAGAPTTTSSSSKEKHHARNHLGTQRPARLADRVRHVAAGR